MVDVANRNIKIDTHVNYSGVEEKMNVSGLERVEAQ
jgi:hypothetical protein